MTNNIEKQQKNKGMFEKKYYQRYITFGLLIVFLGLYMFTGAISTAWVGKYEHIEIANYFFIAINCIILGLVNFEILKLNNGHKWPILVQILTYFLIIVMYLFPIEHVANDRDGLSGINYPFYIYISWEWLKQWLVFLIYFIIVLIYMSLTFFIKEKGFSKMLVTVALSIFMVFAFKAMTKFMLNSYYGWSSVLWLAIIIIATDSFAFAGGLTYGKHKLAPAISPNKTWEGAVTGLLAAVIFSVTYATLVYQLSDDKKIYVFDAFDGTNGNTIRYVVYVLLAFILSIVSMGGDLLFSFIKRSYNIKDFSNLLPGHGGILDRLDSFSLVFVVMYVISSAISGLV